MVVYAPRTIDIIVPKTLQIGWQIAGARAGNEQITAKLIVEFFQIIVGSAVAIGCQTLCSGHIFIVCLRRIELQLHPLKERRIILEMTLKQLCVAPFHSLLHPFFGSHFGLNAHISLGIMEVRIEIDAVIGVGRDEENHLISSFYRQRLPRVFERSTMRYRLNAHHILHAIAV